MKVLVIGGAGYVGSHAVKAFRAADIPVTVFDNLSEGHRRAVGESEFVYGDVSRREDLDAVLGGADFDAAVHFAARCYVGESVEHPRTYWRANAVAGLTLLEALVDHAVPSLIFSSTCAVYGEPPANEDLGEDLPRAPVNAYGHTKAAFEWAIEDFARAYPLRHATLRYFNAAGADREGELGEDHDPETHLIPLVMREAREGTGQLRVFGTDWPTPDGTCVRDYVHVDDLADAHVRAVRHLFGGGESLTANLGTGRGGSVLDVIRAVEERSGRPVRTIAAPRRAGDPARLVARPGRAAEVLGWEPSHSSLDEIVDTAWRWREAHPKGYR